MPFQKIIVREPLLDPKHHVLGYKLSWEPGKTGVPGEDTATLSALAAFAASQLNAPETGWRLRDHLLFLNVTPAMLDSEAVQALHPANTVLMLASAATSDAQTPAVLKTLRTQGFRIALRDTDAQHNPALVPYATHVELTGTARDAAVLAKATAPSLQMLAAQVSDWKDYDACAALGMDIFARHVYLTPRVESKSKGINAAQGVILQLMDLVRKNADPRELEAVMKRDAALSFKLFRYINSVGFGLGTEIQSLRHAVALLGYSTLFRWLSLLLATASVGQQSAVLLQAAIIRARFAELLGQAMLEKSEAGNLFVTGMFSLLDRLLGISMQEVLAQIQLPEDITDALLTRAGMYGPFLALTEACETGDGTAGALAEALFLDVRQVNEAHLAAMAWAQSLEI